MNCRLTELNLLNKIAQSQVLLVVNLLHSLMMSIEHIYVLINVSLTSPLFW